MPRRKQCYWTRKLELELVEFVRQREFIWQRGNTNHHIQQKYKAYAEFAFKIGQGFTARSVRDRWVNIRCTFNHNLRRVDRSKLTARTPAEIYVPCWPLWKPLQFLRDAQKRDDEINFEGDADQPNPIENSTVVKTEEICSDYETEQLRIRQRGCRTDRPRRKIKHPNSATKCISVINDLVQSMKPLTCKMKQKKPFWFFGKHVTERLNLMNEEDAKSARDAIMTLLNSLPTVIKVESEM